MGTCATVPPILVSEPAELALKILKWDHLQLTTFFVCLGKEEKCWTPRAVEQKTQGAWFIPKTLLVHDYGRKAKQSLGIHGVIKKLHFFRKAWEWVALFLPPQLAPYSCCSSWPPYVTSENSDLLSHTVNLHPKSLVRRACFQVAAQPHKHWEHLPPCSALLEVAITLFTLFVQ